MVSSFVGSTFPAAVPGVVTKLAQSADAPPSPLPDGDIDIHVGGGLMTAHPVAVTSTLPFIGRAGVLVDFDLAQRAALSNEDYRVFQVWLARGGQSRDTDSTSRGIAIGSTTSAATRLGQLDRGHRLGLRGGAHRDAHCGAGIGSVPSSLSRMDVAVDAKQPRYGWPEFRCEQCDALTCSRPR